MAILMLDYMSTTHGSSLWEGNYNIAYNHLCPCLFVPLPYHCRVLEMQATSFIHLYI